jgi:hypothetical protein
MFFTILFAKTLSIYLQAKVLRPANVADTEIGWNIAIFVSFPDWSPLLLPPHISPKIRIGPSQIKLTGATQPKKE